MDVEMTTRVALVIGQFEIFTTEPSERYMVESEITKSPIDKKVTEKQRAYKVGDALHNNLIRCYGANLRSTTRNQCQS